LIKAALTECGAAQVSFVPEISANYGLSISVQGIQIQGSPFKIRVRNDETIASHCRLYGPNVAMGVAGEKNTFFIQGEPAAYQNIIPKPYRCITFSSPLHTHIVEFSVPFRDASVEQDRT
jgi:hypothetical protein